jgi:hypothetical protein
VKKTNKVLKGKIENVQRVRTRTGNSMITFTVGGTPCKAFGKGAETVSRWMETDPHTAGEFEGFFEKRSERFGTEFVAVHSKAIEIKEIDHAGSLEMTASGAGGPGTALASALSGAAEPIPAASKREGLEESSPAKADTFRLTEGDCSEEKACSSLPAARQHKAPDLKKNPPVTTGFRTFEEMERYYYATHPGAAETRPS